MNQMSLTMTEPNDFKETWLTQVSVEAFQEPEVPSSALKNRVDMC